LYPDLNETPTVPNSHLLRNPKAIQAEISHATMKQVVIQEMEKREVVVWEEVAKLMDFSKPLIHNRLAVIHSCLFPNQSTRALEHLLTKIRSAGLQDRLDRVLVFHYGAPLSLVLSEKVQLVHVSNDSSLFEIPTLRLLQRLATTVSGDAQLLYLHTKGVSYASSYAQIEDWVSLMLHFLVEKHTSCYHLLASEEFDAVGVNYCTQPRMFSGNFFWASAKHLHNLAPLSLYSHKYDAEYWLFRSRKIRVYVAHVSNVFHASQRYPRHCYSSVAPGAAPSFEVWTQQCQEDNRLEYDYLHGSQGVIHDEEVMQAEQMAAEKVSTARCTALELYRNDLP